MVHDPNIRYSDADLQEFKELITVKVEKAQEELDFTQRQIDELNENGFNQQGGDWYDDSTAHTELELLQRMASRQQRHIHDLQNALLRIQNKTYGVCTITGQLIDKNRLRLVPHATKSIDGKNIANAGKDAPTDTSAINDPYDDANDGRPAAKPIGDKVRIPGSKRPRAGGGEEWDLGNSLDDAGYRAAKPDDEEE